MIWRTHQGCRHLCLSRSFRVLIRERCTHPCVCEGRTESAVPHVRHLPRRRSSQGTSSRYVTSHRPAMAALVRWPTCSYVDTWLQTRSIEDELLLHRFTRYAHQHQHTLLLQGRGVRLAAATAPLTSSPTPVRKGDRATRRHVLAIGDALEGVRVHRYARGAELESGTLANVGAATHYTDLLARLLCCYSCCRR